MHLREAPGGFGWRDLIVALDRVPSLHTSSCITYMLSITEHSMAKMFCLAARLLLQNPLAHRRFDPVSHNPLHCI
jgi:hypothetical protein